MRTRNLLQFSGVAAGLVLAGCAGPGDRNARPEMVIDRQGIDVVAADYARQFTYFKAHGTKERYCRGPGPDAITTSSSGVELGVPTQSGGVGAIGSSSARGGVDLGGRNPAVLISRELLYRACELASNVNADPATELRIYQQFLDAIVTISKTQVSTGNAALAATPMAPALPQPVAAAPQPNPVDGSTMNPGSTTSGTITPPVDTGTLSPTTP